MWSILPCRKTPNFLHIGLGHQYCNFNINTFKDAPHCRVTVVARVLHACIIRDTQFFIWIQDSKPPGIWTWISRTKSGYADHWATLHWCNYFFCNKKVWSIHCGLTTIKNKHNNSENRVNDYCAWHIENQLMVLLLKCASS